MKLSIPLGAGAAPGANYDATVLADSPVSFWTLGDSSGTTAADSGDSNPGTYTGGFTLGQVGIGDGDTAVALNGSSGYVNVPDAANLRIVGNITIESWVKPTDFSNYNNICAKNFGAAPAPYDLRLQQTTGVPMFIWNGSGGQLAGTSAPSTGVWSMVAITLSGTTVTHYLNGSTNGGGTMPGTQASDGGHALKIGQRDDLNSVTYFKGSIAKIAIWNSALTGTQIANHYAAA